MSRKSGKAKVPGARGPGRPTLYDDARRATVLDALRLGLSYESAAKRAGVVTKTLYSWRAEHPGFAEECERAIGECEEKHVQRIDSAALDDAKWSAWFLERRFPRQWGNLRPEVLAMRAAALEAPEQDPTDGVDVDTITKLARGES
jgi:transposase